jgi:hypothetical protein
MMPIALRLVEPALPLLIAAALRMMAALTPS